MLDPRIRQEYLDHSIGDLPEYVLRVGYAENEVKVREYLYDFLVNAGFFYYEVQGLVKEYVVPESGMAVPVFEEIIGTSEKMTVLVTPSSFKLDKRSFLSCLRDHEFFHARDMFYGIRYDDNFVYNRVTALVHPVRWIVLKDVMEVRANANQLEGLIDKGLRETEFFGGRLAEFEFYMITLIKRIAENDMEEELKRKQIRESLIFALKQKPEIFWQDLKDRYG